MKLKLLTVALLIAAATTYAFANAPNTATATANISTAITQTSGGYFIGTDGQNNIACTALLALTEGGVLVGTELATVANANGSPALENMAIINTTTAANKTMATVTTPANKNDANTTTASIAQPNTTSEVPTDAILPIAGADITGFAYLTG